MKLAASQVVHQDVYRALDTAIDMASRGSTPNDALYKAASEQQLNPDYVRRMVEAFNTSSVLAHMKSAASPSERGANIPLADADIILGKMYPEKPEPIVEAVKAAAYDDGWFGTPRNFNKAAAAEYELPVVTLKSSVDETVDVGQLDRQVRKQAGVLQRQLDVAMDDLATAHNKMHDCITKVATYFRRLDHVPFADVESNVLATWGPEARSFMDILWHSSRGDVFGEKRGSVPSRQVIFDDSVEPYVTISNGLGNAAAMTKAAVVATDLRNELADFTKQAGDMLTELRYWLSPRGQLVKESGDPLSGIGLDYAMDYAKEAPGVGALFRGKDEAKPKEQPGPEKLVSFLEAQDPFEEADDRGMKAQLMLTDFLANDQVISTYPEADVIKAYDELSNLAPLASTQSALVRPLLYQMLQQGGPIQNFDLKPLLEAEQQMQKLRLAKPSQWAKGPKV